MARAVPCFIEQSLASRRKPEVLRSVKNRPSLSTRAHAVFELAPGLLLVFKPRGHREDVHSHPQRVRLRVLRGRLVVRAGKRAMTLRPHSRPFTLAAGRMHATRAMEDTWLVTESLSPRRRVVTVR